MERPAIKGSTKLQMYIDKGILSSDRANQVLGVTDSCQRTGSQAGTQDPSSAKDLHSARQMCISYAIAKPKSQSVFDPISEEMAGSDEPVFKSAVFKPSKLRKG